MTEQDAEGLRKIRRALLSVSDKTGIVELATSLSEFGVELISTGGTAKALREADLDVRDISDVTGFPEMMDGRVKTLHPRIHGGLLALRDNAEHLAAMSEHDIEPIDMVVVNLYPFEQTIAREGVTLEEAIEQIDIGGPSMIRSAAKNFKDVAVVVSAQCYADVIKEMKQQDGALSLETRAELARRAFGHTAAYDGAIYAFLNRPPERKGPHKILTVEGVVKEITAISTENLIEEAHIFPDYLEYRMRKSSDLRYGENPHQVAALYAIGGTNGVARAEMLNGKEMSFNNYVDADAAWQLVTDFDELACAIIKHTNPAGVALGQTAEEAYRRALETDPVSAFGGIVAFNRTVDERAARALIEIFTEVVIAPGFSQAAIEVLRTK